MLMRTDPFRELDRVAQQVLGTPTRPAAMAMDAFRSGDDFVVQFDLPGVESESIDLTVEKNVLTVHAERRRPAEEGVEMVIAERPQGIFSRQLFLGESLDTDRLEANYENGVLILRVPVAERAKPRRVPVGATHGDRTAINTRSEGSST
jgi:HSP20 family protein